MEVLLVNPNSSLIEKSWAYRKFLTPIAPLNLAYLAGVLEKEGIVVSIYDQYANKAPNDDLLALIKNKLPAVVGISVLTPVLSDVKRLVEGIRKIDKKIRVVLGNVHPSCFPDEVIADGLADIVVRGEGEATALELCQRIFSNQSLHGVAGITFSSDGAVIHNSDRAPINDLNSLPFPAWHLLDLDKYREVPQAGIKKVRAFPILASRGCTHSCYYCSQDKIHGKVRYRDLNSVANEMEYFYEELGIKMFGFCDAYFPANEKIGLEFCDILISRGLHRKIKWCTESRVDKVTPKLLRAMKESGLHLMMYGIEVGNEEILKSTFKGTTLAQARQAVKETKKAKIFMLGLFMLGLPGETAQTCRETIEFAKELDCDISKFNIATPYPGSRFFEDFKMKDKITSPEMFTSWLDWTPELGNLVYTPFSMTSDELRYLQRRAMLEFYLRPKVFFRHVFSGITSFKNIFYGGIWLIILFATSLKKKVRK